jgi:hypothetical protein
MDGWVFQPFSLCLWKGGLGGMEATTRPFGVVPSSLVPSWLASSLKLTSYAPNTRPHARTFLTGVVFKGIIVKGRRGGVVVLLMASSAAVWLLLLLDSTAADGIVMVCVVLGRARLLFLACVFFAEAGAEQETVRFVRTIGGASDSYG